MPERRLERFKSRVRETAKRVRKALTPSNAFFKVREFLVKLPRDLKTLRQRFHATVVTQNGKPVAAVKPIGRLGSRALLLVVPAAAGCAVVQGQGATHLEQPPAVVERARSIAPSAVTSKFGGVTVVRSSKRGGAENVRTTKTEPFIIGVDRTVEDVLQGRAGEDVNSIHFDMGRIAELRDAEISMFLERNNWFTSGEGLTTERIPHAGTGSGEVTTERGRGGRESVEMTRAGLAGGIRLRDWLRGSAALGLSDMELGTGSRTFGTQGFNLGGRLDLAPSGLRNVRGGLETLWERVGSINNTRLRGFIEGQIPITRDGKAVVHVPGELSGEERRAAEEAGASLERRANGWDLTWNAGLTHTQVGKMVDDLEAQLGIGARRTGKNSEFGLRAYLVVNPGVKEGRTELHFGRNMGVGVESWWTARPNWPTVVADLQYRGPKEVEFSLGIDAGRLIDWMREKDKPRRESVERIPPTVEERQPDRTRPPAGVPPDLPDKDKMRWYHHDPSRESRGADLRSYRLPPKTIPKSGKKSR